MKTNFNRFVVYGNSFQSAAICGYLIRIANAAPSHIRVITPNHYHTYDYHKTPYMLGLRDKDEIEKPILKCYNELIDITFDPINKFILEENQVQTYDNYFKYDYLIHAHKELDLSKIQDAFQDELEDVSYINDIKGCEKIPRILLRNKGPVTIIDQNENETEVLQSMNLALRLNRETTIYTNKSQFHPNEDVNLFVKKQIEKKGIRVNFNCKFQSLDQGNKKYTLIDHEGNKQIQQFNIMIFNAQENKDKQIFQLSQFDIDKNTLSHKRFKNVFFLGPHCHYTDKGLFHQDLAFHQCLQITKNVYKNQVILQIQENRMSKTDSPYDQFQANNLSFPVFSQSKAYNNIIFKDNNFKIKQKSYFHYWKYMNWYPYLYFNGVPGGVWGGPMKGIQNTAFQK